MLGHGGGAIVINRQPCWGRISRNRIIHISMYETVMGGRRRVKLLIAPVKKSPLTPAANLEKQSKVLMSERRPRDRCHIQKTHFCSRNIRKYLMLLFANWGSQTAALHFLYVACLGRPFWAKLPCTYSFTPAAEGIRVASHSHASQRRRRSQPMSA